MPSSTVEQLFAYFDTHQQDLLEDLYTFLRFKSISSEVKFASQVRECADWLSTYLKDIGLDVQLWEGEGHPVIFATWLAAGPDRPTALIYSHYDVQPVDPLELWNSPPFEPTLVDNEIYARGAVDDKGQCFYIITAIKALLERDGKLPVNLKLCIEGDEETDGITLHQLAEEKSEELRADHFFVVDLGFHHPTKPAVTLGVRGITAVNVEITGTNTDLHSGEHGGIAYNPNHALVELLSKLHDKSGKVTVPGFYDDIVPLSEDEKMQFCFDFDSAWYENAFSGKPIGGEQEYAPLESAWLRPTLEINGLGGGYTGSGFKTVIPGKAMAKISCRLVPDQDPQKINKLLTAFLEQHAPPGVEIKVETALTGGKSVRTHGLSKATQAAAGSFSEVCGTPCRFILAGGSIPAASLIAKYSGAETVLLGYALPGDNLHAPNEHFGIDRLRKGHATIGRLLERLVEE